jgi:hypothetical protein
VLLYQDISSQLAEEVAKCPYANSPQKAVILTSRIARRKNLRLLFAATRKLETSGRPTFRQQWSQWAWLSTGSESSPFAPLFAVAHKQIGASLWQVDGNGQRIARVPQS